jgi:hypothetical protein
LRIEVLINVALFRPLPMPALDNPLVLDRLGAFAPAM